MTFRTTVLAAVLFGTLRLTAHGQAPAFSDLVVFGDSLSDTGNVAARAEDEFAVRYPGDDFNYTDGSFTDGRDTDPNARLVIRVWHEQLAQKFLRDAAGARVKRLNDSEDGGQNYAFGGAKTTDGQTDKPVLDAPDSPSITIDNMGKQVSDYLGSHTPSASTLFIVWGGGNDLFDDPSATNVTQTANNVGGLVTKLATAGARSFIVPNVPPLGMVPEYNTTGDDATIRNQASASYKDALNTVLDQTIAGLAAQPQPINITIYRLDVYSLFLEFIANPAAFGYVNATDSSQGLSVDPDKYLFWDAIHPTTTGHYYLAAAAYSLISGQSVVSVTAPISEVKGGDPAIFFDLVRIGGDDNANLVVPYTVSGTATEGTDYLDLKGTRRIKPGKHFVHIKLQTLPNSNLRDDATVALTLGTGTGYSLGGLKTATVTIDPSSAD